MGAPSLLLPLGMLLQTSFEASAHPLVSAGTSVASLLSGGLMPHPHRLICTCQAEWAIATAYVVSKPFFRYQRRQAVEKHDVKDKQRSTYQDVEGPRPTLISSTS